MENDHSDEFGTHFEFRDLERELRTEGELDLADACREYADKFKAGDYLGERMSMRRIAELTRR